VVLIEERHPLIRLQQKNVRKKQLFQHRQEQDMNLLDGRYQMGVELQVLCLEQHLHTVIKERPFLQIQTFIQRQM
jgi:hypothetical protein